jgi:pimeloyl-ACP methyl ester carboxylesterase
MIDTGPTSHSFFSQRLRLHYVDWGNPDAPPLILQHGGRDHCRSWDWVAEELRKDWHVICPDLRGHGDSAWVSDGDYDLNAYVYDFAQLIEALGFAEVSVIAHSLGGNIATRYAGLYPEKIRRFVNIEGLGFSARRTRTEPGRSFDERFRNWIEDTRKAAGRLPRRYSTLREAYERMKGENRHLTDEQARHLTIHGASRNEDGTWSWKFDPYLHVWTFNELPKDEITRLWERITCPTLLLWGKDSLFSSPADDGRADHFQDARVIEYENAGHWLHHDQFERFMADVKAFL